MFVVHFTLFLFYNNWAIKICQSVPPIPLLRFVSPSLESLQNPFLVKKEWFQLLKTKMTVVRFFFSHYLSEFLRKKFPKTSYLCFLLQDKLVFFEMDNFTKRVLLFNIQIYGCIAESTQSVFHLIESTFFPSLFFLPGVGGAHPWHVEISGQGSNLCHNSNPSCCNDHTRSLKYFAAR